MYSKELFHHGIKGQRWGVRRFQNRDGSRTPRGLEHLKEDRKDWPSENKGKSSEVESKSKNDMLNSEAKKAFRNLALDVGSHVAISAGQKYISGYKNQLAGKAVDYAKKQGIIGIGSKAAKFIIDGEINRIKDSGKMIKRGAKIAKTGARVVRSAFR